MFVGVPHSLLRNRWHHVRGRSHSKRFNVFDLHGSASTHQLPANIVHRRTSHEITHHPATFCAPTAPTAMSEVHRTGSAAALPKEATLSSGRFKELTPDPLRHGHSQEFYLAVGSGARSAIRIQAVFSENPKRQWPRADGLPEQRLARPRISLLSPATHYEANPPPDPRSPGSRLPGSPLAANEDSAETPSSPSTQERSVRS